MIGLGYDSETSFCEHGNESSRHISLLKRLTLFYISPGLTFENSTFCLECVYFVLCVRPFQKYNSLAVHNINRLVF